MSPHDPKQTLAGSYSGCSRALAETPLTPSVPARPRTAFPDLAHFRIRCGKKTNVPTCFKTGQNFLEIS